MTEQDGGPVVVGVSPSTGSPSAVRWAAEQARLWHATLRAVLAWRAPRAPAAPAGRPPVVSSLADDPAADAAGRLEEFVVAALGSTDGVECRAVHGSAASALLAASKDARLIVLGEPRPGRLGNLRTSLVAPQLIHRTPCPLVVMPDTASASQPPRSPRQRAAKVGRTLLGER